MAVGGCLMLDLDALAAEHCGIGAVSTHFHEPARINSERCI
jgi:hypothetical protein